MSPPVSTPPAPPGTGNAKYVAVALLLLLGIGGIVVWKIMSKPPTVVQITAPPPSVTASEAPTNPLVDDVPPPPPIEEKPEAGPPRTTVAVAGGGGGGCEGKCVGTAPPELERALQLRGAQAKRCYNAALAQDPSLKGNVSVNVRVAPNGQVCSANVVANDMGTNVVANCVANTFRATAGLPAPHGGCVDAKIPMRFVAQGQ
jgi:hypothetical protein